MTVLPCHAALPKATPGTPDLYRTGLPLHVYLPPALRRAFEDLATANRRTLTEEVAIALEERLEKFGKWPPPPP